jgi:hypothetical protein
MQPVEAVQNREDGTHPACGSVGSKAFTVRWMLGVSGAGDVVGGGHLERSP